MYEKREENRGTKELCLVAHGGQVQAARGRRKEEEEEEREAGPDGWGWAVRQRGRGTWLGCVGWREKEEWVERWVSAQREFRDF